MFLFVLLSLPNHVFANTDYHFYVNEEKVELEEPAYIENNRLYVPLRFIADRLGAQLIWHEEDRRVELISPIGDKVSFKFGSLFIELNGVEYIMDASPLVKEGRTYLPIRHAAEFLHMRMTWNNEDKAAHFYNVPLYTVKQGDTLLSISEQFGVPVGWMKERNGLKSDALEAGQTLKVIIPGVISDKEKNEGIYLLAKIITVESGHEPLKGQIAVGNVIMNRVEDPRFPNSIREVIYAPNQFPPALNGLLDAAVPNESSILAVQRVMAGENVAKGALYFFNPRNRNSYFESMEVVVNIGNHRFVK